MNKIQTIAICALALLTGACASDEPAKGGEERVSITLFAPETLTRAEGTVTVDRLSYAIFDITDGSRETIETTTLDGEVSFPMNLNLDLVAGHQYGLLFWAGNADAPYIIDLEAGTLTADYTKAKAGDPALDGFYGYATVSLDNATSLSLTLQRPFAMVAIGATTEPATDAQAAVSVSSAATTLNLLKGETSGDEVADFATAPVVSGEDYPVEGYYYVTYAYVLEPKAPTKGVTVSYTYNGTTVTANDVTLQANYRTNIYGTLPGVGN
ncbi:MAG: hypothetical protein J1F07_08045 [Muribaculaceae bacterium]|nr:hypothetical protein [Muribaculaceae bacterium]